MDWLPVDAIPAVICLAYLLLGGPLIMASWVYQERQYRRDYEEEPGE